jgi:hypothetical protein
MDDARPFAFRGISHGICANLEVGSRPIQQLWPFPTMEHCKTVATLIYLVFVSALFAQGNDSTPLSPVAGKLLQESNSVSGTEVRLNIDWPAFLARHDLAWSSLPKQWQEGAFTGNGLLGAMIYSEGTNVLQWDVGRSDVTDRGNRIVIGRFALIPAENIARGEMRLDLWNAEAHGKLFPAGEGTKFNGARSRTAKNS